MPHYPQVLSLALAVNRRELKIDSIDGALERISEVVEEFGEENEWAPDILFRVNLALEEIGLNAINYGSKGKTPDVEIILESERDRITVIVTDAGVPFDPLNDAPLPDLDAPIEERHVGGLGVHLVREMMDEVTYERIDGRNCLTMMKRRGE